MWSVAERAALYSLYTYLMLFAPPEEGETLRQAIAHAEEAVLPRREQYRLSVLQNALADGLLPSAAVIGDLALSESGLCAAVFTEPQGEVHVVFRGTGDGEWIDSGEGLSGVSQENTYTVYGHVAQDYATDQQVEALNYFHRIAATRRWNGNTRILLSGHSKGGNKAQFVGLYTALADAVFSFDGQGFSPEALQSIRKRLGTQYDVRRARLWSISADNDYVNVLGERAMAEDHVFFLESAGGWHSPEAILTAHGRLRPPCEQGRLSRYVQEVSENLMKKSPRVRQYATRGVMNVFQHVLGEGEPVNGDSVSVGDTLAGLSVALGAVLHSLG